MPSISWAFFVFDQRSKLSLGELRSTTSALESVFLSFLHTRVTCKEACCLKGGLISFISCNESTSKTVTDCTCLTGDTTTVYKSDDVPLTFVTCSTKGLVNDKLKCFETEVCVDILAVDCNNACTGNDSYTSNGFLSSTCTLKIGL